MRVVLKIWRQKFGSKTGQFVSYPVNDVNPAMSMLECRALRRAAAREKGSMSAANTLAAPAHFAAMAAMPEPVAKSSTRLRATVAG